MRRYLLTVVVIGFFAALAMYGCGNDHLAQPRGGIEVDVEIPGDGGPSGSPSGNVPDGPEDTTPPTVTTTVPGDGATNVATNTLIVAAFSEEMDPATINNSTITVQEVGNGLVGGTVSYSNSAAVFSPTGDLKYDTSFMVTVSQNVQDLAGNEMTNNYVWQFSTGIQPDLFPPEVVFVDPLHESDDVSPDTNIVVTFSEEMNPTTITSDTFFVKDRSGNDVQGTITVTGKTATFDPAEDLLGETDYIVTVTKEVQDLTGLTMVEDYNSFFTTTVVLDTTPPVVISSTPEFGAENVLLNTNILIVFSEAMDPDTITTDAFFIQAENNDIINFTAELIDNDEAVLLSPLEKPLMADTVYRFIVRTDVTDLAGNPLTSSYQSYFITGNEPNKTPPEIISVNPAEGAIDVPTTTNIIVNFNEPMDPNTITPNVFFMENAYGNKSEVFVTLSPDGMTATFDPTKDLVPGVRHIFVISETVTDLSGTPMENSFKSYFETAP